MRISRKVFAGVFVFVVLFPIARASVSAQALSCTGPNYFRCDLTGHDFSGQDLTGAILEEAKLSGAKFDGANLSNASFRGSRFSDASFVGANLTDARFDANFGRNVSFTDAIFVRTSLGTVNWPNANFVPKKIEGVVSFGGASITGNVILPKDWQLWSGYLLGPGAEIHLQPAAAMVGGACPAQPPGLPLNHTSEVSPNLVGLAIKSLDATDCPINLSNTNLEYSNFSGAILSNSNFSRADLSHANLGSAWLGGVDFTSTNLSGAALGDLRGVPTTFDRTNLSGAGMSFRNAPVRLDLSTANLEGFSCCGLAGTGDISFSLPDTWYVINHTTIVRPFRQSGQVTTSGVFKVGKSVKAVTSRWEAGTKFSYQWLRNGFSIQGANKSTYKLTLNDRRQNISVRVTASKPSVVSKDQASRPVMVK